MKSDILTLELESIGEMRSAWGQIYGGAVLLLFDINVTRTIGNSETKIDIIPDVFGMMLLALGLRRLHELLQSRAQISDMRLPRDVAGAGVVVTFVEMFEGKGDLEILFIGWRVLEIVASLRFVMAVKSMVERSESFNSLAATWAKSARLLRSWALPAGALWFVYQGAYRVGEALSIDQSGALGSAIAMGVLAVGLAVPVGYFHLLLSIHRTRNHLILLSEQLMATPAFVHELNGDKREGDRDS